MDAFRNDYNLMAVTPKLMTADTPKKASAFATAAGVVVAGTLLSRIVGMLREVVIAHQFGVTWQTDAYNAAFKLPDTLMYLIAGGALASTFIPVFTEYLQNDDHRGAWKTFSIVSTITALAATFFVVVAEIFASTFVRWLNPGFVGERLHLAVSLSRIVLPAQIFFMLGGLFMGTLNARKQFLVPSLGPTIYNVGIIIGALLRPELGIYGLMWGALIGAFIGNFALQIYKVVQVGLRYRPSIDITHPGAVKVWRLMMPIVLGVSLPNVDQIISSYFGSELGYGSQTVIGIATRLMLIPIGIFAQAMGIAILPTMSQQAGKLNLFRATTARGLRFILFLTVPSSAIMYILATPIIALLYQHGKFTAHDTGLTASCLRYYSLGIFAWSAQAILTRGFYALQDSWTPVISGSIMTAVFIIMSWYVTTYHRLDWGVDGLACATSIAATLHMLVLYFFLSRRTKGMQGYRTLAMLTKLLAATALLCLCAFFVNGILAHTHLHPGVGAFAISVAAPAFVAMGIFLCAATVFQMDEIAILGAAASRITAKLRR